MTARLFVLMLAAFLTLFSGCANKGTEHSHEAAHEGPTMNFHRINPQLATGGHLVGTGAADLAEQGVTLVIDLRDKPPAEEQERLAAAGIRWVNVPVVWAEPKKGDFEDFSRLMAENRDENIFVQCQANYRASAMTYMYRVTREGVPEPEARKDLDAIWSPEGTWRTYIDEIMAADE